MLCSVSVDSLREKAAPAVKCRCKNLHIAHLIGNPKNDKGIDVRLKKARITMRIYESRVGRMIFARLSEDEDLLEGITLRAKQAQIATGFFSLIGALKKARLGFYHKQEYRATEISEPTEIASCVGNISLKEEELTVHAHISISKLEGETFGGHLLSGCVVSANAELVMVEATDLRLQRILDEETNLHLWPI